MFDPSYAQTRSSWEVAVWIALQLESTRAGYVEQQITSGFFGGIRRTLALFF